MKKTVLFLFLCVTCLYSFSQENNNLEIHSLVSDYYIFTTYNEYNGKTYSAHGMYFLTEEGVVIVDAPWNDKLFQTLLDSIEFRHQQKVKLYFPTHSHSDRAGGLEYYNTKGITSFASIKTDSILQTENKTRPLRIIQQDTSFLIGDKTFDWIFPGHGHTIDNVILWFPEEKILYGGCFIKSTNATNLGYIQEANLESWQLAIDKIDKTYKPTYVIPGHGNWQNPNSIQQTKKLLEKKKD
ncbi:MAG: BlaB/IND/MUS family subclass B1 metallo-beta-lactamase [Reichenbachiella sp.]